MEELGELIRQLRLSAELSLRQLANLAFNDENYAGRISKIETAKTKQVSFDTIAKILINLDVDILELIENQKNIMDKTISATVIQSTDTYINLGETNPKRPLLNNRMHQQFLVKRDSRKLITESLIIYYNTGEIPKNIVSYQLSVLKELIEANYKIE